MIEISTETIAVLSILASVVALIVAIVSFVRKNPGASPAVIDAGVAERIEAYQGDTETVDRLELAYERQTEVFKHAFDTMASLFRLVAPLTPLKSDDAVSNLLTDIQTREVGAQPPADPAG